MRKIYCDILFGRLGMTHRYNSGFTLVELLAVLMIMSVTTVIFTISLSSSAALSDSLQTASAWRSFDAQARLIAKTTGSTVMIDMDNDSSRAEAFETNNNTESLFTLSYESSINLTLSDLDYSPLNTLLINSSTGHSIDYKLKIIINNHNRCWIIYGYTGQMVRDIHND